ncbi:MAG: phosphate ABC transporter permease PstA [Thermomicrobiales bacterium]
MSSTDTTGLPPRSHNLAGRKVRGRIFEGLCAIATLIGVGIFLVILTYLFVKGIGAVNLDLFTKTPKPVGEVGGGVANAIGGTLLIVAIAMVIALPLGIGTGTYLAEFGHGVFAAVVRTVTDVLTGVPSIVIGILAYQLVVVPMHRFSALAGGIALSVIMVPTIVRTTEEILLLVPREYTEAALALGASRWRTILTIVFPAATSGIITGVMLAIARAAGETAPLLFTAFGNTYWNWHLTQPTAALPLQIYQYAISPYADWQRQAWAAALVLVVLILILSALARLATSRQR